MVHTPDRDSALALLLRRFLFDRDVTAMSPLFDHLEEGGRSADLRDLKLIVGSYLAAAETHEGPTGYWSSWISNVVRPALGVFWFDLYSDKLTAGILSRSADPDPDSGQIARFRRQIESLRQHRLNLGLGEPKE